MIVKNGGSKSELTIQLQEIKSQIMELDNRDQEEKMKVDTQNQELRKAYQDRQNEISDLENDLQRKKNALQVQREKAEKIQNDLNLLRDQWDRENGKEFVTPKDSSCPTCGQSVQVDVETLRSQFNFNKSQILTEIDEKGKKLSAEKANLEKSIQEEKERISQLGEDIEKRKIQVPEFVPIPYPEATTTPERTELQKRKEKLEDEVQRSELSQEGVITGLMEGKDTLVQLYREQESSLQIFRTKEEAEARIQEMEEQERKLAAEFGQLEKELFLTETFIRTKVDLLEKRINQKFSKAKFKLFETQINGGLNECCETTYNGVPYSSLNNAARVNIGLDIIKTLSNFHGFTAPIFIDNREAVTQLEPMNTQVISLIVSESDKKLRMESGE